jgi:hypothetical protein
MKVESILSEADMIRLAEEHMTKTFPPPVGYRWEASTKYSFQTEVNLVEIKTAMMESA